MTRFWCFITPQIAPNGNKETYLPFDKSKMQALEKFVRDKMEQGGWN